MQSTRALLKAVIEDTTSVSMLASISGKRQTIQHIVMLGKNVGFDLKATRLRGQEVAPTQSAWQLRCGTCKPRWLSQAMARPMGGAIWEQHISLAPVRTQDCGSEHQLDVSRLVYTVGFYPVS